MTIHKYFLLVLCLSLALSSLSGGYSWAEGQDQSTDATAKKLELRRSFTKAKEHASPKAVTPTNDKRVPNIGTLLKNVQTTLKTQGSRSVKVWKFVNKKLVLKDAFQVSINPGGDNLGITTNVDSSYVPTTFDATTLSKWLTPFLNDTRVFNQVVNVFPVKVSDVNKQINTQGLKKYFGLLKMPLPNVRSFEVWTDAKGSPVMIGLNTVQKGYILYDFGGRVTSQAK